MTSLAHRFLSLLVGSAVLVSVCCLDAVHATAAAPGCTNGGTGYHGCNHANGEVVISGSNGAGGRHSQGRLTLPDPTVIWLSCDGDVAGQVARVGITAPADSIDTCRESNTARREVVDAGKDDEQAVLRLETDANGDWQYAGNECVEPGPARVTPELVRQQAVRLIPTASVGVAPKGTTLVNIETVLWADAPRQRELAPVTILGQRVVVRIVLDHVAWRFGDGEVDTAGPAGKAYDDKRDPCKAQTCSHYYGHTYAKTGTVTVSATASWHASFGVAGGAPVDIPGTVDGPASQANIVVKQARAVLVPNPGDQP